MSLVIIFGHWLDFYQMVFASVAPEHVEMNLFDFGVALGFVGVDHVGSGQCFEQVSACCKKSSVS